MTRGLSKKHQQSSQQDKDIGIDVHQLARQIFQSKEFIEGVSSLIKKAIAPLQQRIKLLEDRLEKLESSHNHLATYDRRLNLRIHGIPEVQGENVEQLVIDTCSSIGVNITSGDISVYHRLKIVTSRKVPDCSVLFRELDCFVLGEEY
ncbi:unnamed protein product [Didymodactylos carnosus]|uniref:Uncharacterized protein n=1 Tax=Didymodactylos carnosus TaxID=1234261 RepID=A0A815I4I9_9BILA|nr:unnamed protein product [Didymodactylos carnosus]CAF1360237.1 unnamed protein product [Didymodactylos carnosus]CAF3672827.1 unnamed protein product [Didymodactylos carnosus]CAF4237726.1 unnamed protein product [Didymodactylos carnosus]